MNHVARGDGSVQRRQLYRYDLAGGRKKVTASVQRGEDGQSEDGEYPSE